MFITLSILFILTIVIGSAVYFALEEKERLASQEDSCQADEHKTENEHPQKS